MFIKTALSIVAIVSAHAFASVSLSVQPANPVLLENQRHTTIISIDLEGADMPQKQSDRMPVNISVVIDESGSMSGDRIQQAKEAARTVVGLLGPQDVFSLVVYSDEARTLIPAAKLTNKANAMRQINRIESDGSTALFAGVSKGIAEVRKNRKPNHVNRVILLSDGMANIGPSSPAELEALGRAAGREGISVTTIGLGLGYNEDLMSGLALASDGNHAFVENPNDLARIFETEIGGALSIVAQTLKIQINCANGVRPIRILDQDAEIRGQNVQLNFNQIYAHQKKTLLLEVELDGLSTGKRMEMANVQVNYLDQIAGKQQQLASAASVSFTTDRAVVRKQTNKQAILEAGKAKANIASQQALELRDKGDFQGAGAVMKKAVEDMRSQAVEYEVDGLLGESEEVKKEAEVLSAPASAPELNRSRKELKSKQYERKSKYSISK